jgi:hypothetical protein
MKWAFMLAVLIAGGSIAASILFIGRWEISAFGYVSPAGTRWISDPEGGCLSDRSMDWRHQPGAHQLCR